MQMKEPQGKTFLLQSVGATRKWAHVQQHGCCLEWGYNREVGYGALYFFRGVGQLGGQSVLNMGLYTPLPLFCLQSCIDFFELGDVR